MPRRAAAAERERGLLIVNADDWGLDTATTNAIHECLAAGAVTSVSAMVHMGDSARAATLPVGPVGLHLNLTTPFTDPRCPELVRRRHDRLIRQFSRPTFRLPGCDPRLFGEIKRSVGDQLAAFRELYGRDPTHVDGHHHVQQSLGVILSRSLPNGDEGEALVYLHAGREVRSEPLRAGAAQWGDAHALRNAALLLLDPRPPPRPRRPRTRASVSTWPAETRSR